MPKKQQRKQTKVAKVQQNYTDFNLYELNQSPFRICEPSSQRSRQQYQNYDILKSPSFFIQSSFKRGHFSNLGRSSNRMSFKISHQVDLNPKNLIGVSEFNEFEQPLENNTIKSYLNISSSKINDLFFQLKQHTRQMSQLCQQIQVKLKEQEIDTFDLYPDDMIKGEHPKKKYGGDIEKIMLFQVSYSSTPILLVLDSNLSNEQKNTSVMVGKFKAIHNLMDDIINQQSQSPSLSRMGDGDKFYKVYMCKYCNVKFPKACSLGGHISRVHKQESNNLKIQNKQISKSSNNKKRNRLLENIIENEVKFQ